MKKLKVLFYDIENSPNTVYTWGVREQDAAGVKKHWELLSFAYKWQGEKTIKYVSREGKKTDESLVRRLHKLLDSADVVVAHNGVAFDNRKSNARFLKYKLPPPKPYRSIDTLLVARKKFHLNSCSLNELAQYMGLGKKVKHPGFELWEGCMRNDSESWKLMRKYNIHDVLLLQRVYNRLRGWIDNHPLVYTSAIKACVRCGSKRLQSKDYRRTLNAAYKRWRCADCGGTSVERISTASMVPLTKLRSE